MPEAAHPTIDAFVAALNGRDLEALERLFTEDIIIEWPQSGERIRGGANRREIYRRFPALPVVSPRRVSGEGAFWVLEADFAYDNGETYQGVFLFVLRAGRIAREVGYWTKPFPAPPWRAAWVERI